MFLFNVSLIFTGISIYFSIQPDGSRLYAEGSSSCRHEEGDHLRDSENVNLPEMVFFLLMLMLMLMLLIMLFVQETRKRLRARS
jgi:hypothetical protein